MMVPLRPVHPDHILPVSAPLLPRPPQMPSSPILRLPAERPPSICPPLPRPPKCRNWNNGRPLWRSGMSSDHEPDPAHRSRSLLLPSEASKGTPKRRDIWFRRVQDVGGTATRSPVPAAACIQQERGHAPQGPRSDTSPMRTVSRRLRLASDPTGSAVLPWRFRGGSRPDQIVDADSSPRCLPRQVQLRQTGPGDAGIWSSEHVTGRGFYLLVALG